MQSETKQCQKCNHDFSIEPEDFTFYDSIDVPPPTFCPECRMKRRMVFMNERTFFHRSCDMCDAKVISAHPTDAKYPVYCNACWWSDKWNPTDYGMDYDFNRPFFEQFKELMGRVPLPSLDTIEPTMTNSPYASIASYLKNCYLFYNSDFGEDSAYGQFAEYAKDSYDLLSTDKTELCYECVNVKNSNKVIFSIDCEDCHEVAFSKDLIGCTHCFGCAALRNQNYCIFNEQYSKDEYEQKMKEFNIGSYKNVQEIKEKSQKIFENVPHKYMHNRRTQNVTGDYVYESKNAHNVYQVVGAHDVKYSHLLILPTTTNSYDLTMWGGNANHMYDCIGAGDGQDHVRFCYASWCDQTSYLDYCMMIKASSNHLFGCVALNNGSYCILNKQYTKEEYTELLPKIKQHMNDMPYIDSNGIKYTYGEFFPAELSQFAYNETVAQQYMPLDKNQAEQEGFGWADSDGKGHTITLHTTDIPDDINSIDDSITGQVIECEHKGECNEQCTGAFRIISGEYTYLKRMGIALPRLCPNCRHYERLHSRNPIKLHQRTTEDGVEVMTSYAPDRPEKIYSEKGYNDLVN